MENFDLVFDDLRKKFLEIENLKLIASDSDDEAWEHIYSGEKIFRIQLREFNESLKSDSIKDSKIAHYLISHIANGAKTQQWENVFIATNLFDSKAVRPNANSKLCEVIKYVLLQKDLISILSNGKLVWSKSAILDLLINQLNLTQNQDLIITTVNLISMEIDKDDIENYHLVNNIDAILNYIQGMK